MAKKHDIVAEGIPEVAPQFDQALLPAGAPAPPPIELFPLEEAETDAVSAATPAPGVELTEDETRAVLADAVAKKQREIDADKAAAAASRKESAARQMRVDDPRGWVGLDPSGSGTYEYRAFLGAGNRRLQVAGNNFEHVDVDADGVWLYRAMD